MKIIKLSSWVIVILLGQIRLIVLVNVCNIVNIFVDNNSFNESLLRIFGKEIGKLVKRKKSRLTIAPMLKLFVKLFRNELKSIKKLVITRNSVREVS